MVVARRMSAHLTSMIYHVVYSQLWSQVSEGKYFKESLPIFELTETCMSHLKPPSPKEKKKKRNPPPVGLKQRG